MAQRDNPQSRQDPSIPNPTPSLPKTPKQKPGDGIKSVRVPAFREFSAQRFDGQIKTLLRELGKESPYFAKAAEAAVKNGITFKMYSADDRSLSGAIHADMKTGHYGAFTLHDKKQVVVNLEALQRKGKQLARPETEQLIKCLANESMHVICSSTFEMYSAREAQAEFQAVKSLDSPWSKAELSFQKVFVEELASKVAETTIRKQLTDPKFEFTASDLSSGRHYYSDMKQHIVAEVFDRMFDGAQFNGRNRPDAEQNVVERAKFFVQNGGVDQRVATLLRAHGLMKP